MLLEIARLREEHGRRQRVPLENERSCSEKDGLERQRGRLKRELASARWVGVARPLPSPTTGRKGRSEGRSHSLGAQRRPGRRRSVVVGPVTLLGVAAGCPFFGVGVVFGRLPGGSVFDSRWSGRYRIRAKRRHSPPDVNSRVRIGLRGHRGARSIATAAISPRLRPAIRWREEGPSRQKDRRRLSRWRPDSTAKRNAGERS